MRVLRSRVLAALGGLVALVVLTTSFAARAMYVDAPTNQALRFTF